VPDIMFADDVPTEVELFEMLPVLVPLPDNELLLLSEPLDDIELVWPAEASAAVQLPFDPVAADWYCSAPASMPVGRPAPAQPVRSIPTPKGRPASGNNRRRAFILRSICDCFPSSWRNVRPSTSSLPPRRSESSHAPEQAC